MQAMTMRQVLVGVAMLLLTGISLAIEGSRVGNSPTQLSTIEAADLQADLGILEEAYRELHPSTSLP
jgi:hypothetical protein